MDPLFTGCDCRRWKFREDKLSLEGWEHFFLFFCFIFSGKTSLLWRVENVFLFILLLHFFREDKFALEGGERGREAAAWLPANCSRAPRLPARRHVHRVCGHGWPGGFWISQDPVLRWRRPIYHFMYGRQSAFSSKCEVSAATQTKHQKHYPIEIEQW